MDLATFFADKRLSAKQRASELAVQLERRGLSVDELAHFAASAKDPIKATCLEALELATRTAPERATPAVFELATQALSAKAPAVKREAGRVIGNTAQLFPKLFGPAITALLANTDHEGTVVRWSAAFALGEILKLGTPHNKSLIPGAKRIMDVEEKDSIRKIYAKALKQAGA